MQEADFVRAAFAVELFNGTEPKRSIVYLPEGEHEISATVNGKPANRTVKVESGIEKTYQSDLDRLKKENVPPFIDYLHEGGRAAGHPESFTWEQGRGLVLNVRWTESAKQVIASKELQFFSPEFLLSEDGEPLGLHPTHKAIGGLVSDPAFTSMESIAAQRAAEQEKQQTSKDKSMDLTKFIELGAISADEAKNLDSAEMLERIAVSLQAAHSHNDKASKAEDALVKAEKEKELAQAEIKSLRDAQADSFIEEHIKAGRIKGRDEDSKKFWRDQFNSNPDVAKAQITNIPASDLSKPVVKASVNNSEETNNDSVDLYSKAKELVMANKANSMKEAISQLGNTAYQNYMISKGLGERAAEIQAKAQRAIYEAHIKD
ncbi:MAG: hypothetical protein CL429_04060 [Acidimicrobiaceae bacterium]|nr:hypothetical protein [Acidimicrobiaceae bacterium]